MPGMDERTTRNKASFQAYGPQPVYQLATSTVVESHASSPRESTVQVARGLRESKSAGAGRRDSPWGPPVQKGFEVKLVK